jgi:hypothetical protein
VIHSDGRRAGYGALAARAAAFDIEPGEVRLKEPGAFRLIGQPVPRVDSRIKADGSARFGIDARPPGLVYAAVRMSPVVGGKVGAVDAAKVKGMPGVIAVADFSSALAEHSGAGAGVAVVASTWWQARQAAQALPVNWIDGEHARLSSEDVFEGFARAIASSTIAACGPVGSGDGPRGIGRGPATCATTALARASISATAMTTLPALLDPQMPIRSGSMPGSPCKYDIALRTSSTCFNGIKRVRLITTSAFLRVKRTASSFFTRSASVTKPSLFPQPR